MSSFVILPLKTIQDDLNFSSIDILKLAFTLHENRIVRTSCLIFNYSVIHSAFCLTIVPWILPKAATVSDLVLAVSIFSTFLFL